MIHLIDRPGNCSWWLLLDQDCEISWPGRWAGLEGRVMGPGHGKDNVAEGIGPGVW